LGASLSIWENGTEILGLADGFCDRQKTIPWMESTLVLLWSATKGPASASVLHGLQENGLTLETRIAEVWPEFAALEVDQSVFDHEAVLQALARHWLPTRLSSPHLWLSTG